MALDPTFSREEAASVPVLSTGGADAGELLEEALRRRWVEERDGGGLAVTAEGRREAERYLRWVGL
jgi:hypothetical protein